MSFTFTDNGIDLIGDSTSANGYSSTVVSTNFTSAAVTGLGSQGLIGNKLRNRLVLKAWGSFGFPGWTSVAVDQSMDSAAIDNGAVTPNPAGAITGVTPADNNWHGKSTGEYTPRTSPSQVVCICLGTNDASINAVGWTVANSMATFHSILDKYTGLVSGTGVLVPKQVFLGNMFPRGTGTVELQAKTFATATLTYTATVPSALPFKLDAADWPLYAGTVGYNGVCGVVRADGTKMTKVSGAPNQGEYSVVNATGVYTFNALDTAAFNGTLFYITFSYKVGARTGAAYIYQETLKEFLSSSASNFTSTQSGSFINFNTPGALYNRPNVYGVDTYGALLDPSSPGGALTGYDGVSQDGIHLQPIGSYIIGDLFAARILAVNPSLYRQDRIPAYNNWQASVGTGAQTVYTGLTMPGYMVTLGRPAGGWVVRCGAIRGDDSATPGTIVGTGIVSGSINSTTGAFAITFSVAPASNQGIWIYGDDASVIRNGLFDPAQGDGPALGTNITGTRPQANWTLSPDTNSQTAITAGTFGLDAQRVVGGVNSVGDGYKLSGTKVSGTGTLISLTNQPVLLGSTYRIVPDPYYACCSIKVDYGPNGQFTGLDGVDISVAFFTSSSVTRCNAAGVTQGTTRGGGGISASNCILNNMLLANGPIVMDLMSPVIDTTGMTLTTVQVNMRCTIEASKPQDWSVTVSNVALKKHVQTMSPSLAVTGNANGSTYDFGTVNTNTNTDKTFTITNNGSVSDTLGTLVLVGAGSGYSITGTNPSGHTIAAGATDTVTIRFNSASTGTKTGSITIPSLDAASPYVINFTANAITGGGGGGVGSNNLLLMGCSGS